MAEEIREVDGEELRSGGQSGSYRKRLEDIMCILGWNTLFELVLLLIRA